MHVLAKSCTLICTLVKSYYSVCPNRSRAAGYNESDKPVVTLSIYTQKISGLIKSVDAVLMNKKNTSTS
jgi:hypothetical protein